MIAIPYVIPNGWSSRSSMTPDLYRDLHLYLMLLCGEFSKTSREPFLVVYTATTAWRTPTHKRTPEEAWPYFVGCGSL